MNQDLSAGLGAGLMNLGNMFSQMLMRRMDAKWEDEQYEKRLAAAQKAEMEKLKALDAYKATRQAGAVPFMPQSDQGPMQPMMQPVNEMGEAIGAPRGMQPHEQYKFEMGQGEARAAAAQNELMLQGKLKELEAKDVRMERDRAQTGLAIRRTEEVGKGKEKEPKGWKSETYAQEQMDKLSADLHPSLVNELESREALLEQSLPTEYDETVYAHALKRIYDEIKRKNDELMRKARMTKAYGDEAEELFKPKIGAPK